MANKVIVSKKWALSLRDCIKSALFAVGTPVMFQIQQWIDKGELDFNWRLLGKIAVGAFVLYIGKQLTGSPKVTTVYKTNAKAVNVAEDIKDAPKN